MKNSTTPVVFNEDDWEVLSAAVAIVPELKICAAVLRESRARQVEFPIKSFRPLTRLLPEKSIYVEGHRITAAHIKHYMTRELFPIVDEGALARAVYVALMRCNAVLTWAAQAPENADAVLAEYKDMVRRPRRK